MNLLLAMLLVLPAPDPSAAFYLEQCATCHTVSGEEGGLDLKIATQWPAADLEAAIRRMEENVGPMTAEQVAGLVELLKSGDLQQRLAPASPPEVIPGSPERGRALFSGRQRFASGGAPCAACHAADGEGGTLAADLTLIHTRMGGRALAAAIERAPFPLMKPHYAKHPVAADEAADLVAFLATTAEAGSRRKVEAPPLFYGGAGALAFLVFGGTAVLFFRRP